MTRNVSLLAAIAALVVGPSLAGCGDPPPPPKAEVVRPAKTMTLQSGTGGAERSFPGVVRAAQRAKLAFNVRGTLKELTVEEGQFVEEGTLIARLDSSDYDSRVAGEKAKFGQATAEAARAQELYAGNVISLADYQAAQTMVDVTRAGLNSARKTLSDTRLLAPFSGRISRKYLENFQQVQAKQAIVDLQDVNTLELVVDLPERTIGEAKLYSNFVAVFDGLSEEQYPVAFKAIGTEADPRTRTFPLTLSLPGLDGIKVLPGMTASVRATRSASVATEDPGFLVPSGAVFADENGVSYVWKVDTDAMTVHRVTVTLGPLQGPDIAVLDGVADGETIATAGVHSMREGMKIKLMSDE